MEDQTHGPRRSVEVDLEGPGGNSWLVGGWATYPTYPSEKRWSESQLGWWHSIPNWMDSHKIPWFQTTNQKRFQQSNEGNWMQKEGNHVTNISRTCNNNGTLVDLARPNYPNYVSFTTEINIYQQEQTYLPGQPGMLINCSLHLLVTVVETLVGKKQVLACSCLSGEVIYFYVRVFSG